jgi:hypothetical protein
LFNQTKGLRMKLSVSDLRAITSLRAYLSARIDVIYRGTGVE